MAKLLKQLLLVSFQDHFVRSREKGSGKEGSELPSGQTAQPCKAGHQPNSPQDPHLPQADTNAAGRPQYGIGLAARFYSTRSQSHSAFRLTCTHHHPLYYLFLLQPLQASSKFPFIFNIYFRVLTPPGSLPRLAPIKSIPSFS